MVSLRLVALLVVALGGAARTGSAQDSVAVVVHAELRGTPDANTIRRVFLARQRYWQAGLLARPVNQRPQSPTRDMFSRAVLGGRVQDFAAYWNDQYFHGTSPPPALASDEAVLRFVARTRGAIGYVSVESARAAGDSVRIVLLVGPP